MWDSQVITLWVDLISWSIDGIGFFLRLFAVCKRDTLIKEPVHSLSVVDTEGPLAILKALSLSRWDCLCLEHVSFV